LKHKKMDFLFYSYKSAIGKIYPQEERPCGLLFGVLDELILFFQNP